jgi:hypothetical protein
VPSFIDLCREYGPQIQYTFPDRIEFMMAMVKLIDEGTLEQQQISMILDCGIPSLEWLVANRRRQFELMALMYGMMPPEEKGVFINGCKDWWRQWRKNEDLAEAQLAEHRRRGGAAS